MSNPKFCLIFLYLIKKFIFFKFIYKKMIFGSSNKKNIRKRIKKNWDRDNDKVEWGWGHGKVFFSFSISFSILTIIL